MKSMIKVISFDLDGCICDSRFDELIWRKAIPEIYAKERALDFETAYSEVAAEYARLFRENEPRWREIRFWFEHFDLRADWGAVMEGLKGEVMLYGDVIPVVKRLQQRFKVVLFSTANRDFLDMKLNTLGIEALFDSVFITSDFGEMKKTGNAFNRLLQKVGVSAEEMIHIGDNLHDDHEIPNSVGIKGFIIDRQGKMREDYAVRTLNEFADAVENL